MQIYTIHLLSAGEMTYVNLQLNPERYTGYAVHQLEGYGMPFILRIALNVS